MRRVVQIIAVSIATLIVCFAGDARLTPARKLRGVEAIGTTLLRSRDQCLMPSGYFVDHAIAGLSRQKTASGVEFARHGQPVTAFPGQIRILITVYVFDCKGKQAKSSSLQNDLQKETKFRVRWMDPQPVEVTPLSVSVRPNLVSDGWRYVLVIPSEGVPLGTPLNIEISTESGSEIGQIQRSLASDSPLSIICDPGSNDCQAIRKAGR